MLFVPIICKTTLESLAILSTPIIFPSVTFFASPNNGNLLGLLVESFKIPWLSLLWENRNSYLLTVNKSRTEEDMCNGITFQTSPKASLSPFSVKGDNRWSQKQKILPEDLQWSFWVWNSISSHVHSLWSGMSHALCRQRNWGLECTLSFQCHRAEDGQNRLSLLAGHMTA